jgi:hypothetical protein
MDQKEKLKFLKKMGFQISRLEPTEEEIKNKGKVNNRVDRSEILAIARTFDVIPEKKKQQNLEAFLQKEGEI